MLKNLKFPLLYVAEFVVWLPLAGSFYWSALFWAARPVSSFQLGGKSLPLGWEAAVANHGKYLQGYSVDSHPIEFFCSVAMLIVFAVLLYPLRKAQAEQAKNEGAEGAGRHKAANLLVMGALVATAYFAYSRVLVGVSPV